LTLDVMATPGEVYSDAENFENATPLLEEALKLIQANSASHRIRSLKTTMNIVAINYFRTGKFDPGLPLIQETARLRKDKLGAHHPATLGSMRNLALAYRLAAKPDQAAL
jgi:hypothetical protein